MKVMADTVAQSPTYRIADWAKHYENNRTRDLKFMEWVPVPNRMDGFGYNALVSGPQGAANLGCWLAIVEIASRCDVRGTLVRGGITLTSADLAMISRLPKEAFDEALPILVDRCKWLEQVELRDAANPPQKNRTIQHEGADPCLRARSGNGTEAEAEVTTPLPPSPVEAVAAEPPDGDEPPPDPDPDPEPRSLEQVHGVVALSLFESRVCDVAGRIKARHPPIRANGYGVKQVQKRLRAIGRAVKAGQRVALLDEIDANHAAWCDSEQWRRDGGEYAKGLENWLREDRFLERPATESPPVFGRKIESKMLRAGELWVAMGGGQE